MSNLVNDFEVRKETLRALGGNPDGLANIYEVDLEILKLIGSSEQGIPDAPIDGVQYARQDGEWTPVDSGIDWNTIKQKLAEDGVESIKFIMGNEQVILTATEVKNLLNQTVLPDAPSDGKTYGRNNGAWTPVEEGITDAPSDGKQYARQDGDWTSVKEGLPDAPSDGTQYARQDGAWVPVQTPTEGKYLTLTADKSNSGETIIHPNIEGSLPNLNLQYRINNGKWTDFIVGTTADIKMGAGDVLQFKGDNKEGVSNNGISGQNSLNFAISGNPVALSGNIMSLIDGVGDALEIPCDYCFCALFRNSAAIKTVSSDFLPATTLKDECYRDLFSGCHNLTQAPELPATTLANGCYNGMFYNCVLLTTAPELPAKVLVDSCYGYMFTYCNTLNYVKCLATEGTINGDGTVPSALDNWLDGVSSTGTFEKLSGVSYEAGAIGIPEGWTVKEIYEYVEAPMDGKQYARQDGTWTVVEPGITDAPTDGQQYARQNGNWTPVESVEPGISDAPSDGKQYARQDGAWAVVEKGILDAPIDGVQYARQDGTWTPVESGLDWNTIKQKIAEDGVNSIKFLKTYYVHTKKYIGFDDGALPFRTGHTITTNTRVQMKFRCLKGTDNAFIGMYMSTPSNNKKKWRFVSLGGSSNAFQQICDGNVEHRCTLLNINPDNWYELEIGNCYIKDVQTGEILAQNTDTESGSWGELVLNACRGEKGDIEYVKVFEGDELVRDYIAAADEDDNIGFYESLSSTFTIASRWQRSENNDWTVDYPVQGEVILTGEEVETLLNQTVLPDAPSDSKTYGRNNGNWTPVEEGLPDAPSDGKQYARQDGAWAVVEKGILDAPIDGVQYARQNGEWTPVEMGLDWNTIKQKLAGDGVESIKFIMAGEEIILTASEVKTLINQTVLPDAPSDGKQYARQDGAWTHVEPGISDAPSDGTQYARKNGAWTVVTEGITDSPSDGKTYGRNNGTWTPVEEGLPDAPSDGTQYARQDGNWTPIESVEPGIPEAPLDGVQYARQNAAWVEVSKVKTTNNTMLQFWNGTQEEYDAIATKDSHTLYIIK